MAERPIVQVKYADDGWFEILPADWGPGVFDRYVEGERKRRVAGLKKGTFSIDGTILPPREAAKMRERIIGAFEEMPPVFDPTQLPPTRPLIPLLWMHGAIPAVMGVKGVGKTTFVCQIAAALIIRGRRFLDRFEPAMLSEAERRRDVWLINSETRPTAVHEELLRAGLVFALRDGVPCYHDPADEAWEQHGALIVEHLPTASGGAMIFDLTDDAKRRWWEERFIRFTERRRPPFAVIADGVTAMLGSNTSGYGAWTSGFRLLLQEAGIPNGLGVLHSPKSAVGETAPVAMNGIESVGEWDGMWFYAARSFPVYPWTGREFYTSPRMGDPTVMRHRITMDEAGLLRAIPREQKAEVAVLEAARPIDSGHVEAWEPYVPVLIKALSSAGEGGLIGKELVGEGRVGVLRRQARDRLVKEGKIFSVAEGQSARWFLAEFR